MRAVQSEIENKRRIEERERERREEREGERGTRTGVARSKKRRETERIGARPENGRGETAGGRFNFLIRPRE